MTNPPTSSPSAPSPAASPLGRVGSHGAKRSRLGLRVEQARWEFALPDGARRLIAAGDFNGRDNESLIRWLASDRELSRRLLRWCNTPLFNLSKPYASLEEASRVMDGRELSRLAVLAWVRGKFLPDRQVDIYRRGALWSHSMAVAAVAAMISRTCSCADASTVFVAGALHDIGLLAIERQDPDAFAAVLSEIDELSPTHEVERDVLGWDHCDLGAAVLQQWGLPEPIRLAALHHHAPEQVIGHEQADTVACVAMANYFCSRSGWSSVEARTIVSPPQETFGQLGIDSGLLVVLWHQVPPALESIEGLS